MADRLIIDLHVYDPDQNQPAPTSKVAQLLWRFLGLLVVTLTAAFTGPAMTSLAVFMAGSCMFALSECVIRR